MTQNANSCTCHPPMLSLDCPMHGELAAGIVEDALRDDRLIAALPPDTCEFCGKEAELRPYGPKGERICFACGMKDQAATEASMARRFG